MPRNQAQRILMALDGSARSLDTVRHIARFRPFKQMDMVLFHVFSHVPECYYDLEKEPKAVKVVTGMRAWEVQQKKQIKTYMEQAKEILAHHGVDEANIHIVIQNRKSGIARDIVREAQKGYDAIIIRRRGSGAMRPIVIGSVASKLIEKLSFVPVLITGRIAPNERVLVGLDGSPGAMRALEFVANRLGGGNFQVHLLHVIRGGRGPSPTGQRADAMTGCLTEAETRIEAVFDKASRILQAQGFSASQISTQVIKGAFSRAASITEEAKAGDYATIVLGRRGQSSVKDFFIGRVTQKVIQAARRHSVWIIT